MTWIKCTSGLLTDPKVHAIARRVTSDVTGNAGNVTSNGRMMAVGCLMAVWLAANEHATDTGLVESGTLGLVDEWSGVSGFGEAMSSVGWLKETAEGLVFKGFDGLNTPAKKRAKTNAERQAAYRAKRAKSNESNEKNVTGNVTGNEPKQESNTLEQSRAELCYAENSKYPLFDLEQESEVPTQAPKPPPPSAGFDEFWATWPAGRKVAKPEALRAWCAAVAKSPAATIMAGLRRHLPPWASDSLEFIPHPATWLRRHGWEDDAPPVKMVKAQPTTPVPDDFEPWKKYAAERQNAGNQEVKS